MLATRDLTVNGNGHAVEREDEVNGYVEVVASKHVTPEHVGYR